MESIRRIADPESCSRPTFSIPFEDMGVKAVEAMEAIAVRKQAVTTIVTGPALYMDAVLIDGSNVAQFAK